MANREKFRMSIAQRQRRHFSVNFKKSKIREIEAGISRISDICKEYEVSTTSVYKWVEKYGTMQDKPEKLIIEDQSDTKELLMLRKKIAELEQVIGQKQVLLDFKDKMIDLAEGHYKVDIKKKFSTRQSSTTGKTVKK